MDDCVFCKVVAGTLPSNGREDHNDGTIASFLSIAPVTEGHTLVVPQKHYRWFYDIPDGELDELFRVAKSVSKQLREKTGADFIQLTIVGEEVPHVHVHLIPRKFEDGSIAL